jgi:hypothetical protein
MRKKVKVMNATDAKVDVMELLEIDELLTAAGFPRLDAESVAQVRNWSTARVIGNTALQFVRRWDEAVHAVQQVTQRCMVCNAERALCSTCAADRVVVHRLAGAVFFLCRVFAERARQEQQQQPS